MNSYVEYVKQHAKGMLYVRAILNPHTLTSRQAQEVAIELRQQQVDIYDCYREIKEKEEQMRKRRWLCLDKGEVS